MNIRKPTDYSTMFAALDAAVAAQLPQMELYCEIGRVVSGRSEKGAAVAASEYLQAAYPTADGFSPRNVRRMRDFWQLYSGTPELLGEALHLNRTQNVVIMEAELPAEERRTYERTECGRESRADPMPQAPDTSGMSRYAADKAAEAHDEAMERWLCRYLYRRVKAAQKRKERIEKKVPKS